MTSSKTNPIARTTDQLNVSVLGLGYVGAVTSACLALQGHRVTGVDSNPEKVKSVSEGRSPVVERDLGEIVQEQVSCGRLRATTSADEAVARSQISLICVGTPSAKNGSLECTSIRNVCSDIGKALRKKPANHIVVVRSTVLPGTTSNLIIPTLEETSGKSHGDGFRVVVNPEFLREGTSVADFFSPPFTLIGVGKNGDASVISKLYDNISAPQLRTSIETAEMVKYACNAFHALKIAFANEIGSICKQSQIDSREVMDIFVRDEKLNLSAAYLKPAFAFGGSCLPKDLRALLYHARSNDVAVPLMNSILASNDMHLQRALETIFAARKKRVAILGLSFKEGTDDLRESPMVHLTETLLGKGYQLKVFDPNVSLARLVGANKRYIETEIPHIERLLCQELGEALSFAEVLVLANGSEHLMEVLPLPEDLLVVDLTGNLIGLSDSHSNYVGICW